AATIEIYTLSLHDALPIFITGSAGLVGSEAVRRFAKDSACVVGIDNNMRAQFFGADASTKKMRDKLIANFPNYEHHDRDIRDARSEEHTSELQSRFDLVCR